MRVPVEPAEHDCGRQQEGRSTRLDSTCPAHSLTRPIAKRDKGTAPPDCALPSAVSLANQKEFKEENDFDRVTSDKRSRNGRSRYENAIVYSNVRLACLVKCYRCAFAMLPCAFQLLNSFTHLLNHSLNHSLDHPLTRPLPTRTQW